MLQSPLHVAAYSGDIERLKEALKESKKATFRGGGGGGGGGGGRPLPLT